MAKFCKFIVIALLVLLSSCQENGDIGELFGQWKLEDVSGDPTPFCKDAAEGIGYYLSFQSTIAWAKRSNESSHTYTDVFGNFQHQGDSLFMQFYQVTADSPVQSIVKGEFGFSDPANVRLSIDLTNTQMVLSDQNHRWTFSKY